MRGWGSQLGPGTTRYSLLRGDPRVLECTGEVRQTGTSEKASPLTRITLSAQTWSTVLTPSVLPNRPFPISYGTTTTDTSPPWPKPSVAAAQWSGSKRTGAGASENGGRAEPCRARQLRQLSDWVANCLASMSMATPIEACPDTFQDSVKPLHRGRARSHAPEEAAQQLASRRPLAQVGPSTQTTSNANAAHGWAVPMAGNTSTDSRRQQPRSRCNERLLRPSAV